MAIWKSATDWKKGMFKIEKADDKNDHAGLTKSIQILSFLQTFTNYCLYILYYS